MKPVIDSFFQKSFFLIQKIPNIIIEPDIEAIVKEYLHLLSGGYSASVMPLQIQRKEGDYFQDNQAPTASDADANQSFLHYAHYLASQSIPELTALLSDANQQHPPQSELESAYRHIFVLCHLLRNNRIFIPASLFYGVVLMLNTRICFLEQDPSLTFSPGSFWTLLEMVFRHLKIENPHNKQEWDALKNLLVDRLALFKYSDPTPPVPPVYGPVHLAVLRQDLRAVEKLLASDKNRLNQRALDSLTPLHLAARLKHSAIYRYLISVGADVSLKTDSGETVLHMAAKAGAQEVVKEILDKKQIDPSATDNEGHTALYCALGHAAPSLDKNKRAFEYQHIFNMLESNTTFSQDDIKSTELYDKSPLLIITIRLGLWSLALKILAHKDVDPLKPDLFLLTPLHWAASNDLFSVISCLLERGADPNATNILDQTPMHLSNYRTFTYIGKEMQRLKGGNQSLVSSPNFRMKKTT